MRLIDADLLERNLLSLAEKYARKRPRLALALMTTTNMVRCMDTAATTPVNHGEWLEISTHDACAFNYNCVCSECYGSGMQYYRYCPSCGARMNGDDKK